jgi:hypothetical protein
MQAAGKNGAVGGNQEGDNGLLVHALFNV